MPARGEPLALAHRAYVEAWLQPLRVRLGSHALSDFSFTNLFLFRAVHRYRLLTGAWPAISGVSYDGARHLLPLFDLAHLPGPQVPDWMAGHDCVFPLCAADAARLDPGQWEAQSRDADADYLYPAAQFRDYRGPLLRKKAAQVQQLLAHGRLEAHPLGADRMADAEGVLRQWLRDKNRPDGAADEPACRDALRHQPTLGLHGWVYTLQGTPVGLLLVEHYAPDTAVVRFAKGVARWPGIYPAMFQQFCCAHPALQWLNFEQDLGHPGFRQSKRSYQPARLLAKLRLHFRPGV